MCTNNNTVATNSTSNAAHTYSTPLAAAAQRFTFEAGLPLPEVIAWLEAYGAMCVWAGIGEVDDADTLYTVLHGDTRAAWRAAGYRDLGDATCDGCGKPLHAGMLVAVARTRAGSDLPPVSLPFTCRTCWFEHVADAAAAAAPAPQAAAVDVEACPGCGCKPGDGITAGCTDPNGCGYWRAQQ